MCVIAHERNGGMLLWELYGMPYNKSCEIYHRRKELSTCSIVNNESLSKQRDVSFILSKLFTNPINI